jgi:hypothetical protein
LNALSAYLLHGPGYVSFFGVGVHVQPEESHHLFGAVFLALGCLLVVEALSGDVWHRVQLRTMLLPAALIFLAGGMLMVGVLDPKDRLIHLSVGGMLLLAGICERQHRLGLMDRSTTDLWVIPGLLAAAFETGVVHAHGTDAVKFAHVLLGLTAVVLACVRLYQGQRPRALGRATMFGAVVVTVGVQLLVHPGVEG